MVGLRHRFGYAHKKVGQNADFLKIETSTIYTKYFTGPVGLGHGFSSSPPLGRVWERKKDDVNTKMAETIIKA
jgi:hypothetical protein